MSRSWFLALAAASFCLSSCDESAPSGPATPIGSLKISIDNPWGDVSFAVEVDGRSCGQFSNPCLVSNIPAGVRQIIVYTGFRSSPITSVEVVEGRETSVSLALRGIGGNVGDVAPGFSVTSIDGQTLALKATRGRVVLLAFFGAG